MGLRGGDRALALPLHGAFLGSKLGGEGEGVQMNIERRGAHGTACLAEAEKTAGARGNRIKIPANTERL